MFKRISVQFHLQTRNYDRKRYLKQKKLLKQSTSLEKITLKESFDLLQHYQLGLQDVHCFVEFHSEKPIRFSVQFPHAIKSNHRKIIVFCSDKEKQSILDMGATFVGGDDLIQKVLDNQIEFDSCLSTLEMFPKVIKIARILGPRGVMPSPSKGTVSNNVLEMIQKQQSSMVFETSDSKLQIPLGTFDSNCLQENVIELMKQIMAGKPKNADENWIKTVALFTPFSPALELPRKPFKNL